MLILGTIFAGTGLVALNEILIKGHALGASGGVAEIFALLGVVLLFVAATHFRAAWAAWRGSTGLPWQISLVGLGVGAVATALCLFGAPSVLVAVLPFPLAYGAVLALIRRERTTG